MQIAYTSDPDKAMMLLVEAARDVSRVLREPAPTPYLVSFGTDGINLELGFWIENAAQGTSGVRSTINLNIWRSFAANGISIPVTQREVRIVGGASDTLPQSVTVTGRPAAGVGRGA